MGSSIRRFTGLTTCSDLPLWNSLLPSTWSGWRTHSAGPGQQRCPGRAHCPVLPADAEDVAAAKAEFKAAFDDAAAGGLAAKQAPAPVHTVPALPVNYAVSSYAA